MPEFKDRYTKDKAPPFITRLYDHLDKDEVNELWKNKFKEWTDSGVMKPGKYDELVEESLAKGKKRSEDIKGTPKDQEERKERKAMSDEYESADAESDLIEEEKLLGKQEPIKEKVTTTVIVVPKEEEKKKVKDDRTLLEKLKGAKLPITKLYK